MIICYGRQDWILAYWQKLTKGRAGYEYFKTLFLILIVYIYQGCTQKIKKEEIIHR